MGIVACPIAENIWGGAKTAVGVRADLSVNFRHRSMMSEAMAGVGGFALTFIIFVVAFPQAIINFFPTTFVTVVITVNLPQPVIKILEKIQEYRGERGTW